MAHEHDIPETLTPAATQSQAREHAVCVWWQMTGVVQVQGDEAVTLLDGLTTQDIAAIEVGQARHALFLTTKARIIAPTIAYRASETTVLLELDGELVETLVAHLKKYKLRAKAALEPIDAGIVSIVGPASTGFSGDGWYDSSTVFGLPSRTFLGSMARANEVVAEQSPAARIELADPEALDALRIQLGVPALTDLLVDSMPAEVGAMELAVSLTKGCYLGQEPVARLHYRGKANRTLRQVQLSDELPDDYFSGREPGAEGYLALARPDADRPVGTLTSWARTPDGSLLGMAVLRREVADGEPLRLLGTGVQATAVSLNMGSPG